ncbi:MAG: NERD domain-containing protein [Dehalococcoidia bacterium]
MARMLPAVISSGVPSPGEREVFTRLANDPSTADWVVLHSLDLAEHRRQVSGEADFVVIIPGQGVVVLEVKACESLSRDDRGWYYGRSTEPDARGPFRQAADAMHSLRTVVVRNAPHLDRVVFCSAVLFTYVPFRVRSPEWHAWQVIDGPAFRSRPLGQLLTGVIDAARRHLAATPSAKWFEPRSSSPTSTEVARLVEVLRPSFEFFETRRGRSERLDEEVKHYTQEQFAALDRMATNDRVLFAGPAGTGKTLLAIEAARREAAAGRHTLLVCFNRLLGQSLERQTADLPPLVETRTLHAEMLRVAGCEVPADADIAFWNGALPEAAVNARLAGDSDQYDSLVVDEAQDVARPAFLDFLDLSLRGGLAAGRWRIFGDFERQAIFSAASDPVSALTARSPGLARYELRENCRNTPRISAHASQLGGLVPPYSRVLRPDDRVEPRVVFYDSDREQDEQLRAELERLYDAGYQGHDIVVLAPTASGAAARVRSSPWAERLSPIERVGRGQIAYTTIHAFKGLEANAVVLTDIDSFDDRAQSLFYVGATRSLHRLTMLISRHAEDAVIRALLEGHS